MASLNQKPFYSKSWKLLGGTMIKARRLAVARGASRLNRSGWRASKEAAPPPSAASRDAAPHFFSPASSPSQVKTLTGKEIEIDIEPTDTVNRIKERVEEKEGIPPIQQAR